MIYFLRNNFTFINTISKTVVILWPLLFAFHSNLVVLYPDIPNKGNTAIVIEYSQPITMDLTAVWNFNLLLRFIAYVIANHLSVVIRVSVNTESSEDRTVKNPAIWHPIPDFKKENNFNSDKNSKIFKTMIPFFYKLIVLILFALADLE